MKPTGNHHPLSIPLLLFILLSPEFTDPVKAQPNNPGPTYAVNNFTPSIAIIIAILIAALFFMAFFSIYIRHCSDVGTGNNGVRRALSMRTRRPTVAPGLDAAVLETFPMFSYSEVKDHKIAKGALECAVCLCEFEDDEKLRLIPKCDHVFHPECIDAWLESHVTCPVCRANLVPQPGDEPFNLPEPVSTNTEDSQHIDRTSSRNEEVVIQVDQEPKINRNLSFVNPNRPQRSWSVKVFGLGKFRSHSTGHSLVQPGENLERFTLRLPANVRKDVMHRASLNRTGSCAATTLPREGSSRRGYRGEGGRFRRIDHRSDREPKSDRWDFFTRTFSMKSHKVGAESSSSLGGSSRIPVKLPSLKCLEPKAADETVLFSGEPSVKSLV